MLPPFARARRFLEHVDTLTPSAWGEVLDRVGAVTDACDEAQRHLVSMFVTTERRIARDAISLEARRVCLHAVETGRVPGSRAADITHGVTSATLALILRDLLPPDLFDRAYQPFTLVGNRGRAVRTDERWIPSPRAHGNAAASLDTECRGAGRAALAAS